MASARKANIRFITSFLSKNASSVNAIIKLAGDDSRPRVLDRIKNMFQVYEKLILNTLFFYDFCSLFLRKLTKIYAFQIDKWIDTLTLFTRIMSFLQ